MTWARGSRVDERTGFALLAMLALVLQLAIPQGFMLASDHGQAAIVICTGHGPLLAPVDDHGFPLKAPKPKSNATCAFAGHGGTPTATPVLALTATRYETAAPIESLDVSATPGRGLAAPPPPSQGPPTRIL
jgi:hypothetical protein